MVTLRQATSRCKSPYQKKCEHERQTDQVWFVGSSQDQAAAHRLSFPTAGTAQIVFVRKRLVEIQYLRTTITDEQREEFGRLVEGTIRRIESADFLPHSGIRFPQNPCSSCRMLAFVLERRK